MAEVLKIGRVEVAPEKDWSQERRLLWELIYGENGGTKVTDIAKAIGWSYSAVSMYVRNKYQGNESKMENDVRQYLVKIGRWVEPAQAGGTDPAAAESDDAGPYITDISEIKPVETDDYRRVRGICRMCAAHMEFGVIAGDPGTGKTFALSRAGQGFETALVTIDDTSTKKSILVDLAEELGIEARGTSPTLLRKIVRELKRRPRLVVFDEADLLESAHLFETIRAIYDKARNIGVVLCGNQNLAERLLVMAEERPELARLRDRIGFYGKTAGLSAGEAAGFLEGVNITKGAKEMLVAVGCRRGVRQLVKALARLLEVTRGDRITEELVEELGQIYLGFNA
jgi:DNA transposition AAA+ family ATPase